MRKRILSLCMALCVAASMLPYSFFFLLGWTGLLALWMVLGLPLGPGAAMVLS